MNRLVIGCFVMSGLMFILWLASSQAEVTKPEIRLRLSRVRKAWGLLGIFFCLLGTLILGTS